MGSSHSIPVLRVLYFEFCAPLPILEQLSLLLTLTHRHRPQCWGNQGPERDTWVAVMTGTLLPMECAQELQYLQQPSHSKADSLP